MAIKLINKGDIKDKLYPLEISNTDFITKGINIYRQKNENEFYEVSQYQNKHNFYLYAGIKMKDGKIRNRRIHRLVAQTFIPNNNSIKFPIVGHKNNTKTDDRIENLYWTSSQENTQKAVEDKLLVNKIGIANEFSSPVQVLDLNNNLISTYGSFREAARYIENLTASYISKIIRDISKDYKPRNKNFKYFYMNKEEYLKLDDKYKNKKLTEKIAGNKKPKEFEALNIKTGDIIISDNQKRFALEHNLFQSRISYALLHPDELIDTGDWKFKFIKEKEYIQSSGYNNLINLRPSIKIKNIQNDTELYFKTDRELRDHLGLKGHDSSYYKKHNQLILNQWKVV